MSEAGTVNVDTLVETVRERGAMGLYIVTDKELSDLAARARDRDEHESEHRQAEGAITDLLREKEAAEADRDHWREQERLAVYDAARLARRVTELEAALRHRSRVWHNTLHLGEWETCRTPSCSEDRAALAPDGGGA